MADEGRDAPERTELDAGTQAGEGASAMDRAVRAAVSAEASPPPAAVIAAAREQAQRLLAEANTEDARGLQDLQNLYTAIGLPVARVLFRALIRKAGLQAAAREAAKAEVADFSPITEPVCMRADFHDKMLNSPNVAYLTLDSCPRTHDLGAQLAGLRARVAEDKWPEILRHLSMLVMIGRKVYSQMAAKHSELLRRLAGDRAPSYQIPLVDHENTTLYLDADEPTRVGIFVRLENSAETPAAPK